jgi:hypothetical protein
MDSSEYNTPIPVNTNLPALNPSHDEMMQRARGSYSAFTRHDSIAFMAVLAENDVDFSRYKP